MRLSCLLIFILILSCKDSGTNSIEGLSAADSNSVSHAKGFNIKEVGDGIKIIVVNSPWPESSEVYTYALVPREKVKQNIDPGFEADAIIPIPVRRIIVTSTTHIPSLEELGVAERLIGFPQTDYISSPLTRSLVDKGQIVEMGTNESLNTEIAIELEPDLIVGFGIDDQNKAYSAIESAGIPVVYNGDWIEETPLGKAEWIKFFGPFFEKEAQADSIFGQIEMEYNKARALAQSTTLRPTVLSGALYKDVWYLPAGESWAARFIEDANGKYLWSDTPGTGSLSLSIEAVLDKATEADLWISPSQFTGYDEMATANDHYLEFKAFRERKLFTFARSKGATGGLLYYELGPSRPDMILKDLIHIFHPELMPEHEPYFFKPLK